MNDKIQDEAPAHKYFTMMLNIAEDDLDPFQYRLLAHYVRWSSEGPMSEGVRTTAQKCQMSVAKVKTVRDDLVKLGYLKVTPPAKPGQATTVTVLNRWMENILRYSQDDKYVKSDTHEKEGCVKSDTSPVSKITHIEEQENNIKEKDSAVDTATSQLFHDK